jgi:hypothetical protein
LYPFCITGEEIVRAQWEPARSRLSPPSRRYGRVNV